MFRAFFEYLLLPDLKKQEETMSLREKVLIIILCSIFAIAFCCMAIFHNPHPQKNLTIRNVTILNYDPHRRNMDVEYSFEIGTKKYKGSDLVDRENHRWSFFNYLIFKEWPMIYDAKDPENNELLVFEADFKYFNLEYPDSIKNITEQYRY